MTSLYEFLHVEESDLNINEKIEIGRQVADCLTKIHQCPGNIAHGHLSSRNVFIEKAVEGKSIKYNVKIGDLGDLNIRQHAKIFHDYEIRNTWSSPEVLVDPNIVFTAKKQAMDIYSYGMLLWEVFSVIVPFADNIEAATMFVVEKNCRPKIKYNTTDSDEESSNFVPEEVADVIKKCWAKEPQERPQAISDVNEMLKLITLK